MPPFPEFPSTPTNAWLSAVRHVASDGSTIIAVHMRLSSGDYALLRCELLRLACLLPNGHIEEVDVPIDRVRAQVMLLSAFWDDCLERNILIFHITGEFTAYIMTCEFLNCLIMYSFGP